MTERSTRVVVLLGLRWVWVPPPRSWSSTLVERFAARGEVPSKRVSCRRCQGSGLVGRDRCERCDGRGFEVVDSYTGRPVGDAETGPVVTEDFWRRRQRVRDRDRQLERLRQADLHRLGLIDPSETEGWERLKQELWRQGSFAELERVLGALRRVAERDYLALEAVYGVDSELRRVGWGLRRHAERVVDVVAEVMPEPIRVPEGALVEREPLVKGRWANGWALGRRDVEIHRLAGAGFGQAAIGRRLGVSQQTVSRVLASPVRGLEGQGGLGEDRGVK